MNRLSLKEKYRALRYFETHGVAIDDGYLADLKREVRAENCKAERNDDIHYSENGENCWHKHFEHRHYNEEELEEYTRENWISINSPYDCTGQWFTRTIIFCKTKTGTWIYHFMSLDV